MPATKAKTSPRRTAKKSSFTTKLKELTFKQLLGYLLIILTASTVLWLLFFSNPNQSATTKLKVSTTIYPIYEFAQQVGADQVEVVSVLPTGADAHDSEPNPTDLIAALESDVFIYNYTAMEPWVAKFLVDYQGQAIQMADQLDPQSLNQLPNSSQIDPHFWTDPVMAQQMVEIISRAFSQADPQHQDYYQQNARNYSQKLTDLNQSFEQGLATCQSRSIITSHQSFSYLADRYNIQVLSIAGLSHDQEPSASKMAELKRIVKINDISTIFFEERLSPQLAQTLAKETGADLSTLNPIETITSPTQLEKQDYLSIQHHNLANLRHALNCQ